MAGRHHTLRALEGQNLAEVLEAHVDTLGDSGTLLNSFLWSLPN